MKTYFKGFYFIGAVLFTLSSANSVIASADLSDDEDTDPRLNVLVNYGTKKLEIVLKSSRTILDLKKKIEKAVKIKSCLQTINALASDNRSIEVKDYEAIGLVKNIAGYWVEITSYPNNSADRVPKPHRRAINFEVSLINVVDQESKKPRPIASREDELKIINDKLNSCLRDIDSLDQSKVRVRSQMDELQRTYASIKAEINMPTVSEQLPPFPPPPYSET